MMLEHMQRLSERVDYSKGGTARLEELFKVSQEVEEYDVPGKGEVIIGT